MINVEALDAHADANPLHPQVLVKLKEQAVGQYMSYIPEPLPEYTTDDYFEDCAKFYDWMMENLDSNMGDQEFEELCEKHWVGEPTKWSPFEDDDWVTIATHIVEHYELLQSVVSHAIALQQLGPIAEFIRDR